jgi:hypothetical protein
MVRDLLGAVVLFVVLTFTLGTLGLLGTVELALFAVIAVAVFAGLRWMHSPSRAART